MAQGNNLQVNVVANVRAAQKQINALVNQPYTLNLTTKGGGISAPLGKIKGQLGEFEKSLEASNARVIAFGASASAIYAVNTALRESVKAAIEVEKALKDINVILNLTDKNLGQFGQSLFDIAKNTGNSFGTVASAATELSRQGLGVNETLKRTQDALILTRLSGLDAVSSVEALTASLNGFQKAALTSTEIINKLAAVDASFAVSSGDLAEAIKRVGSSAEDAGVSFDELIAIVTATQQITARGGAVIGNSFKTIFTRLQRTETLDALEQLGIQTKTTEGNIRPLIQILSELGKTFDTLNDVQKAAVAEQVGGVFQINILKAALGDLNKEYSVYTNALNISKGATDEAIKRNEELNTTLAALLNKTIANLTAAGAKIGELSLAPALKKVFGGLNSILESFTGGDSEDIGNKIGEGLLKGLGNFLSGPGLIIGAKILFGIFERLTVFTADAIKSLSGLNAQGAQQAQIQQQIFTILQKNPQIISQIVSGQTTLQSVQNAILTTIQAQTLQMQQQVTLSKSLAASLAAAGVSIARTGQNAGRLQITAGGFVPNLFDQEESSARKMGASNPKAQISAGTIGGQKFIKNNKELEIVGLGKNGDSAVIPTYGSIGDKRQKELYDKMQFLGFIPNFAPPKRKVRDPIQVGRSIGINAEKEGVQDIDEYLNSYKARKLSPEEKSSAKIAYNESKQLKNYDYYNIPASNVGIISASEGGKDFIEYNTDIDKSPLKLRFTELSNFVPKALQGGKGFDKFEDEIKEQIGPAIIKIAEKLRMGKTGDFPNKDKLAAFMKSDQSAYPQLAGRIFETVVTSAINKSLEAPTNKGNTTWDYPKGSFQDADMVKAIFGDQAGEFLLNKDYVDAKRSPIGAQNSATNSSLKSKFFNTPSFQGQINKAREQRNKILKTARGFIPNFGSIKNAMDTEKKMGGNPALDFQDGIGLYVRDRKTQSNFSAVKRDHPEGIGQAIKNSKIAQETLAKGFIPNFIAPGQINPVTGRPAPAIPNAAGAAPAPIQTQPAQKALTDYTNKVLLASVAFSTMSGIVESFTKNSESDFGKMSSAVLNGVSTFASIAAVIPGPIGLVAGGLIGAYQAISGVMEIMRDQTGPIKKGLEEAKEGLSKLNDATQSYAQTYEKLQSAYEDTSKSPQESARIIQKLEKDLSSALAEMPSAYREQLKSAQNLTEIQEIIAKSLAENALKLKQKQSALGLANQITKEGTTGAFQEGGAKKAVQDVFAGLNPEKQAAFFEKYQKGEIQGLKTRKLADGTESLIGGTEDIINVFKELGVSEDELAQVSRMGVQPLSQLQKELKNQTDATIQNNKAAAEATAEADKRIKASLAEKEAKRKEAEAARKAAEAAGITAEANRQVAMSELKLADARKSNIAKIATEAASAELQTAQPFTTAKGMATGQAGIETAKRFSEAQTRKAQTRTESIGKISSDFSNAIGKAIDEGLKGGKNVEALQKGKSKIAGIVQEGGGPEIIAQKLEALGKQLNLEELMNLQSDSEAELKAMAADIALIDEDLKTGNIIAEKQLAEQIKQIRNQERIKAVGGMQGFLDPESLKGPIEKLLGGFEKAQVGKKFGLEMTGARGIAEAGMAALELTGGAGSAKMNAGLKNAVVPQQTKFVEQTFNDLAAQAEATGTEEGKKLAEVFKEQAADAKNIAEAQFDAAFQKEQLPQNVAKILEQVTKIASGDNQTDALKEGIKDATKIGTGPAGAIDTGKSILSGLSTPPKTATTISGKPLFGEKETVNAGQTVPTTSTVAGTNQAQKTIAKREFSPDINQALGIGSKGALTSAEAEKYKAANMAEQDRLRQQAADLSVKAAKGDTTAKAELEQTKNKISTLGERYKGAEGIAQTLAYGERPVKAGVESMAEKVGRTRAAEMQSAIQQGGRTRQQEETKSKGSEKTSKGEVNVSFTPISVDIKGSVETANDELSQKMTDAIKQAVEQIAPGIISKIYGPPRDSAKT